MFKKIAIFLLALLVIIQFIHPKQNKSTGEQPHYIGTRYPVPDDVHAILAKACLDCHSNNTRYPWYCNFQPVDWFTDNHIKEGKAHLNLDEYTSRSLRSQYHNMEDFIEQIKKNEMPLNSYTWIHKDAILTAGEKDIIVKWAEAIQDTMKARYPIDSLIRKR